MIEYSKGKIIKYGIDKQSKISYIALKSYDKWYFKIFNIDGEKYEG